MAHIIWTTPAFLFLEALPEETAFGLIKRADMLGSFPRMGSLLTEKRRAYDRYRQLVYRGYYRLIYEFDEIDDNVYIVAVQNCKRKLPSPRDLKRQMPNGD